jgi:hypothetical protein
MERAGHRLIVVQFQGDDLVPVNGAFGKVEPDSEGLSRGLVPLAVRVIVILITAAGITAVGAQSMVSVWVSAPEVPALVAVSPSFTLTMVLSAATVGATLARSESGPCTLTVELDGPSGKVQSKLPLPVMGSNDAFDRSPLAQQRWLTRLKVSSLGSDVVKL